MEGSGHEHSTGYLTICGQGTYSSRVAGLSSLSAVSCYIHQACALPQALEILQILGTETQFCFCDAYRGQDKTDTNLKVCVVESKGLYSRERMKQEGQGQPGLRIENCCLNTVNLSVSPPPPTHTQFGCWSWLVLWREIKECKEFVV